MRYLLPRIEEVPLWPVIAAPVFLVLFLVITYCIYRKKKKPFYDEAAKLPLRD